MIFPEQLEEVNSKIELLQEQIDNYERSGFYTESDMNSLSEPVKNELRTLLVRQNNLQIMTRLTQTINKG
ncbi:MAG: hypothetical protein RLZZ540_2245 [Bacteroidota bacterium]|jgi:dsDNA-specific endonuclease/ATPase MutS2